MYSLLFSCFALAFSTYSLLYSYSVTSEGRSLRAYDIDAAVSQHNQLLKNGAPENVLKSAYALKQEAGRIESIFIHYLDIDGYALSSEPYDEFLKNMATK